MDEEKTLEKATSLALRYISYRPRSEAEVRSRLRPKHPGQIVEAVVQRLKEQGLLDDRAFAHAWSQSRANSRPRSAALVRRELLQKGVAHETAQAAASTLDDEESAYSAGQRAARTLAGADYTTFRRRVWGYLHRRGFSQAVVRRTVRRLWEERGMGG
ncbi:MAG: RecX family transcriptional regulator [Dehalococcoidia bacterium]|nr:RecX family transcriptional regulator [Dehalococcoidia bacterium]